MLRILVFMIGVDIIVLAAGSPACEGHRQPPTPLGSPDPRPNETPATFPIPVFTPDATVAYEPPLPFPTVIAIAEAVKLPPEAVQGAALPAARLKPLSPPGEARIAAVAALCPPGAPLVALADHLLYAARVRGLDWRVLPVVAFLESGCGLQACGGNAWGLGACRGVNAETFDEGIDQAADALTGWVGRLGLEEALCTWESGRSCAEASDWTRGYRDRAIGYMEAMAR